ncbi:NADH-quinone oxidoreductase subunit C [Peptococcaceae bacterium 1198_IL3148]
MESNQVIDKVIAKYPLVEFVDDHLLVPIENLTAVMKELRDEFGFNLLTNETAVDYVEHFEVIYNLCRVPEGTMLNVKTKVDHEQPELPTMVDIWAAANWQEREIYDLLGIRFIGHPDLRRILLEDDFQGYPLRKDFKWVGGRD